MRKLVVSLFVSLDGVIEEPGWSMPYWNDTIAQFKGEEFDAAHALLLGRVTYDGFAQAWPQSEDEGAEQINGMVKYVVSNTLQSATWNNSHIIRGDVVAEIRKLKAENGGDLLVAGSGLLIKTLMEHNLVDDYRLLIYPVVLGEGQKLFMDGVKATLKLVECRDMGSGVVALRYQATGE